VIIAWSISQLSRLTPPWTCDNIFEELGRSLFDATHQIEFGKGGGMAENLICPACSGTFTAAKKVCGEKATCRSCGKSWIHGEKSEYEQCTDPTAASQLLPLVYDELRKLAAQRLAQEGPCQTLQATALVHEAYLRLVSSQPSLQWNGRGHFFAAAAMAMRRILVENARRKSRLKRGGDLSREQFDSSTLIAPEVPENLLALDEALVQLAVVDPRAAELVNLRYFVGLTIPQAAEVLGVSPRSADFLWAYARAWLLRKIEAEQP
jgi:RNA polymerase sigma factor (TIGR02999 family)